GISPLLYTTLFRSRLRGLGHGGLEVFHGRSHGGLQGTGGVFHLVLDVADFLQVHFLLDVGLDLVDVALGAAEQVPDRAGDLGQAFGADDDQRDHTDQHQFAEADIKHGGSGTRRSGSGVGLFAGLDVDRIGVAGLLRDGRLGGG